MQLRDEGDQAGGTLCYNAVRCSRGGHCGAVWCDAKKGKTACGAMLKGETLRYSVVEISTSGGGALWDRAITLRHALVLRLLMNESVSSSQNIKVGSQLSIDRATWLCACTGGGGPPEGGTQMKDQCKDNLDHALCVAFPQAPLSASVLLQCTLAAKCLCAIVKCLYPPAVCMLAVRLPDSGIFTAGLHPLHFPFLPLQSWNPRAHHFSPRSPGAVELLLEPSSALLRLLQLVVHAHHAGIASSAWGRLAGGLACHRQLGLREHMHACTRMNMGCVCSMAALPTETGPGLLAASCANTFRTPRAEACVKGLVACTPDVHEVRSARWFLMMQNGWHHEKGDR
eukprot:1161685-Pelagomonas_calceolata.AAC.16